MKPATIRAWRIVHTWTSLISTLFLLMLCLTGGPLIFREELDGVLKKAPPYAEAPAAAHADIGRMVAQAQAAYPADFVRTVFVDDDAPQAGIVMTPKQDGDFKGYHRLYFDSRTGALRQDEAKSHGGFDLTLFLATLHDQMFAGLPGEIFLGLMALLFVASLVSGTVLYAPFMRKLDFGAVRTGGSGRLAWLDLHNLIGVVALVWMAVVGTTGMLNAFSTPLFGIWQFTEVAPILKPYAKTPVVTPRADLEKAVQSARAAVPGSLLDFVTFPTRYQGSPVHYTVWLKGDRTLTSRLRTPVLVNATTGTVEMVARMPIYLKALEVSRPLHFGDYGGPLLKVLWLLLDVLSIAVLVTGLYLWFAKRRWSTKSADILAVGTAAVGAPA